VAVSTAGQALSGFISMHKIEEGRGRLNMQAGAADANHDAIYHQLNYAAFLCMN
jgi:hypothetical protein